MMDTELSTVFIIAGEQTSHSLPGKLLENAGLRTQSYESAEQFLQGFNPTSHADGLICALVHVELAGMTGLQLQAHLKDDRINLPIVFLADVGDISQCVRAMKAGAVDFLEKSNWETHLLVSISAALVRYEHSRQDNLQRETLKQRMEQLTRREREIMEQLVSGASSVSSERIAERLHISRRTVEHHRAAIREKMHARSLLELIDMARVCGFQ